MNWFESKNPQILTLKTFTVLVGRAPTKDKRIRMSFSLDLTSGDVKGMPEWLLDAREFVMRTGQMVTESMMVSGLNLSMGDPNLFKKKCVEAPKCDLRKFVCFNGGSEDDPETFLSFIVYTKFSTDLCRWSGQMCGEDFTVTFDGALPEPGDITLKAKEADVDDDDEDDDDGEDDEIEAQQARKDAVAKRDTAKERAARAKAGLAVVQ